MKKTSLQTLTRAVSIASLFLFSGVIVFALQTATGWTNPAGSPPGATGALSYLNGNVGVNTANPTSTLSVNGEISAMGHLIRDVAAPVAGSDAVNKDYVLAQAEGNSIAPFVIYGVSSTQNLIGPDPGEGVPACPAGYDDILFSPSYNSATGLFDGSLVAGGYGPFGIEIGSGAGAPPPGGYDTAEDYATDGILTTTFAAIGTYSLCSTSRSHYLKNANPNPLGTTNVLVEVPACVTYPAGGGGGNYTLCNTCRICGKSATVE